MHIRSVSRIIVMKSKGKTWTKKDWILEIFYTVMRSTGWESNGLCGLGSCCLILRVTFSPSAKCQTNYSQPAAAAAKPARSSQYRISFSFLFSPCSACVCARVRVLILSMAFVGKLLYSDTNSIIWLFLPIIQCPNMLCLLTNLSERNINI